MRHRRMLATAVVAALLTVPAAPVLADHDHYVATPNGGCHQVAAGQTAISDSDHGGYHRFHFNVHFGATDDSNRVLGKGNSVVEVYRDGCP